MTLARACLLASLGIGAAALAAEPAPPADRRSGFDFMSPQTQAMQRDDMANPGMLWLLDGEAAWNAPAGAAGKACADCHGKAEETMRGAAARYPAYDEATGRPITLETRIRQCRTERQQAPPLAAESQPLLALHAYVAHQSRGMPIEAGADPRLDPFRQRGEALYRQRIGQLNFACANCHDDNWGKQLAGSTIPQGHPTAYPLYRLEWQSLGSLQRRLRNCMIGVRAEPFPEDAAERTDLELYLMWRARGLPIETPGVRP